MDAKLKTSALLGIDALPVEVDVSPSGLPKTVLVGLPEAAVRESTHRVERATVISGFIRLQSRLRDVTTGRIVAMRHRHAEDVCSLAFSPDGKTLASGSKDKTIRLWDVTDKVGVHTPGEPRGKGDRHLLPERPSGCFAQEVPVTFSAGRERLPDK